ncbi:MFS transporter [Frankia sp. Cpl3]|nr:MFS transporter [Frankia sp. Cpl3]
MAILFGSGFWSFALFLSLFGAGQGMIRATGTAMITQRTTQGQGVTTGAISSMDSLGRILGPLTGGALYEFHVSGPFVMGAILVAIVLVVFQARQRFLPKPVQS